MRVYLLLFLIFCGGLFLRIWHIEKTFALTYDIGRDLQVVAELSQGNLTLVGPAIGGLPGVFLGPLTYYYTLPLFILAQGDPIKIVMLHGFISALLIPLLYFIAKKCGASSGWALLFAAWFAILSGPLDQARVLWNPSLTPLLLLPLFACMLWVRQKPWLLVVAAGLLGLSLQTQLYTVLTAPVFVIWMITEWLYLVKNSRQATSTNRQLFVIAAAAIAVGGATFLPQLLFEIRHGFNMTQAVLGSFGDESRRISWAIMMENRPKVVLETITTTLHSKYTGLGIWWLGFVYAGLGMVAKRNSIARWLLALLSVPLLFFFSYTGNNGYFFDYYLGTHYIWVLLGVIVVLANLPMSKLEKGILAAITATLALTSLWFYTPVMNQSLFSYTFERQLAAWQTLYDTQQNKLVTVEVFTPNLLPVQYEYINSWYAKTHQVPPAEFNQNLSGNKDVYLLYEAAFSGGSSVAFKDWSDRQHQAGRCEIIKTLGIITVEKCRLNDS